LNKALLAVLVALAALAAGVAGCGGGDDGDTGTTASLTKAEFLKQADAICKRENSKLESEFEEFAKESGFQGKEPSKEQNVEVIEEVLVPNVSNQRDEIEELGAPDGEEDKVEAILDALGEGIEEVEGDPEAVLDPQSDPFGKANELAGDYGLKACGR